MLSIENTHSPIFCSRKDRKRIKKSCELVSQDATGVVIALVVTMAAVLVLALLAAAPGQWIARQVDLSRLIPSAGAETTLYAAVSEGSQLNGRTEPSKDSERCARFEAGDELIAVGYQDGWYEVLGSEYETCWVSADYVSDTAVSEPWQASIESNGRVALRDKPEGTRVGWMQNGDKVTVKSVADGWAHVDDGWVMAKYIGAVK